MFKTISAVNLDDDKQIAQYTDWVKIHSKSLLFHSLPWLDFICREHKGALHVYSIKINDEICGYWPFITVRKGPFRLLGSPLRGWLTSRMGPLLFREPLDGNAKRELIADVKRLCRKEKVAYFETSGALLDEEIMRSAGFSIRYRETWILELEENEDRQWEKLHYNCKKNIKNAYKSGIEIKELKDRAFFRPLYELVTQTYKKKKMTVPFRYERLGYLYDAIATRGQLLFLGAFYKGDFAGGHIWGYDTETAYAFVSASSPEFSQLRINNLLLWEGIKRFIGMGLKTYDMYGGSRENEGVSRFKASFGSVYKKEPYFTASFSRIFSGALNFYENYYLKWKNYPSHN
ncbi:MAG: GNAT family N-acetyltransferase [Candidatus Omnitrophica bacterium]|nr:GNAT family N-acetyltransferase [Candidatus Omnitrophota bacterium]